MHVIQRGVNRGAVFVDDVDRTTYLRLLRRASREHSMAVHAYVLMDNHVHLLVSTRRAGDLSRAMQSVGQIHAQEFNRRHGRVGTLWQGRFKACVVDSDAYLLAVMRYIELNPVRAALCADVVDHRWSSVHAHLGCRGDATITFHANYLDLGETAGKRQVAWKEWLGLGVAADDLASIRRHVNRASALGDERFQEMVERALGRRVAPRPRGRPSTRRVAAN